MLFWLLLVVLLVLVVVAGGAVMLPWTIMVGWLVDSLRKILRAVPTAKSEWMCTSNLRPRGLAASTSPVLANKRENNLRHLCITKEHSNAYVNQYGSYEQYSFIINIRDIF